ncbi:unnamed protein product [Closterium sp. NIES-54]
MCITLYFIVTHLPDSLRSVRDHFLTLDPTSLTVDLLEQHLLAAETSAVAVGDARGTPRSPFFEGCSPSPLSSSFAFAAAVDVSVPEDVGAALTSTKRRNSKGKGGPGSGGGSGGGGGGSGSDSGGSGRGGGGGGGGGGSGTGGGGGGCQNYILIPACKALVAPVEAAEGVAAVEAVGPVVVDLYLRVKALTCPYVIRTGAHAGRTCGRFHTERRCFARLDDAWRTEFGDDVERPRWAALLRSGVVIFDLGFDVIISTMYAFSLSAEGDYYWCVPPDPGIAAAALGASASGTPPGIAPAEALHTFTLDSGASRCFFRDSTTLTPLPAPVPVRPADPSEDAMVNNTTPGGQRVSICTCTRTGRHLATFTRRPVSSLYTTATEPPQVAASCRTKLFFGNTAWVTPPCHAFVACTPVSLSQVSPGLCLPCRPRLPRTVFLASRGGSTPLLTPPRFPRRLLPCRPSTWTFRLQLRERFGQDLPIMRLHSDRGGEYSSDLLQDFCRREGITQSFTLPDSPQQNGIAERRIRSYLHDSCGRSPFSGDPDAPDIPTPRSYAEAITGPYSSQWQAAMDAEMASWKSTGTYVNEVPPPGVNIVDGMWIFRVKRILRLPSRRATLLEVSRDYELHSLDFSTAFLQGSLHEEIWLRRPPGFTGSFPTGT